MYACCLLWMRTISKWIFETIILYLACIRIYTYICMRSFRSVFKIVFVRHVWGNLECHFLTRDSYPFFSVSCLFSFILFSQFSFGNWRLFDILYLVRRFIWQWVPLWFGLCLFLLELHTGLLLGYWATFCHLELYNIDIMISFCIIDYIYLYF